jgi:hypothetical protein
LIAFPNLAKNSGYSYIFSIGQPLNQFKGFHYSRVDPQTGLFNFLDNNGSLTTNPVFPNDYNFSKKLGPIYYGGWGNRIRFHHFELSIFLQYVKQNARNYFYISPIPGMYGNQLAIVMNRWKQKGDLASYQPFTQTYGNVGLNFYNYTASDGIVTNASFIRLKNIYFSYSFNTRLIQHTYDIRTFIQLQNLLTISNFIGLDPESTLISLPPLKGATLGVHINL